MINIDDKTRRLSQATIVVGYKQENKAESIEFKIPDYLKEYGKKICFKTKDGKVFSKLFDNTTSNIFTFTRTETQYGELNATIEFFKTENEDMIIYKTSMLQIIFNESIICEDEVQPDEPKIPILESLIEKVTDLNNTITENEETRNNNENTRISNEDSRIANETQRDIYYTGIQNKVNNGEFNGATFTPSVDKDGNISWTNNKGLENPTSQNIRGPQGIQGPQGEAFKIKKTYPSIEAMQNDFDNMEVGDYAMIVTSIELEDNAKLYSRTETEWVFITDFSGATGIQGEQGPQGIQGPQGERGIGISILEVRDGYLYVILTDNTSQNAGLIITDEVKQWLVNEVTNNAQSNFNTYYNGKVTDFNNYTTTKIQEYDTNARNKINEYDEHAEELTNRITTLESEKTELQLECKRLREDNQAIAITGQESGENITLNDSSDARFKKFEIGGNHSQETREGYNLLDESIIANATNGVVTSSSNTAETHGNLIFVSFYEKPINLVKGEKYYISFDLKIDSGTIEKINSSTLFSVNRMDRLENRVFLQKPVPNSNYQRYIFEGVANDSVEVTEIYIQSYNTNNCIVSVKNLMVSKVNKDYEPYGASPSPEFPSEIVTVGQNGSAEINVCNENYFKEKEFGYLSNINGTVTPADKEIVVTGFIEKEKDIVYINNSNFDSSNGSAYGYRLGEYDKDKKWISNTTITVKEKAIRLTDNTKYIKLSAPSNIKNTQYLSFYNNNYVEHQSQTKVLPIQQEMLEGDKFIKQDGEWYEAHYHPKTVFDGTETWFWSKSSTGFNRFSTIINNAKPLSALISNIAKNVLTNPQYGDAFINESKYLYIYKDSTDVNVWKTYLSEQYAKGTPAIIYYESAEPELIPCIPEQSKTLNEIEQELHTYKDTTHISSPDEISPIFNVEYLKDTQAYIDNQIITLCNSSSSSDTIET